MTPILTLTLVKQLVIRLKAKWLYSEAYSPILVQQAGDRFWGCFRLQGKSCSFLSHTLGFCRKGRQNCFNFPPSTPWWVFFCALRLAESTSSTSKKNLREEHRTSPPPPTPTKTESTEDKPAVFFFSHEQGYCRQCLKCASSLATSSKSQTGQVSLRFSKKKRGVPSLLYCKNPVPGKETNGKQHHLWMPRTGVTIPPIPSPRSLRITTFEDLNLSLPTGVLTHDMLPTVTTVLIRVGSHNVVSIIHIWIDTYIHSTKHPQ